MIYKSDAEGDSKQYIMTGMKEAIKEMNKARMGLIDGIDASDYTKMLENEDKNNEAFIKEYILSQWDQACKEIKLAREGKLKGKPAREFLK